MNGVAAVLFWIVMILGAVCYAVSYFKTRSGKMIVYRDWKDFILSSLWLTLGGCGVVFKYFVSQMEVNNETLYVVVGSIFLFLGFLSVIWLIDAAIKANQGNVLNCVLAIGAKLFVSVLLVVAIERLKEQYQKNKGSNSGAMVIPLAVVGTAFALLVKPLIHKQ